jgi:hypothetical protein
MASIKRSLFINLFYGLASPNVDHWAHASGFGGKLMAVVVTLPRLIWIWYCSGRCSGISTGSAFGIPAGFKLCTEAGYVLVATRRHPGAALYLRLKYDKSRYWYAI